MRRRPLVLLVATAAALLAVGCGASHHARTAHNVSTNACDRDLRTRVFHPFVHGAPLDTTLVGPDHGRVHALPLIVALHGQGQPAAGLARLTNLSAAAFDHSLLVAYPQTRSAHEAWPATEVPALATTLAILARNPCVDPHRIVLAGFSAGGRMAARIACGSAARLIRAIAAVSGGIPSRRRCTPGRTVGVLWIHGTHDTTVPYAGKPGARWRAIPAWVAGFARRAGCSATTTRTTIAQGITRIAWDACPATTPVVLERVRGGTHGWPPTSEIPGTADPDATGDIIRFTLERTRARLGASG